MNGQWAPLMNWPVEATYMVQLYTGELLGGGSHGNCPARFPRGSWNPVTQVFTSVPSPTPLFCSGVAVMSDVPGDHGWRANAADDVGIKTVTIFDPATRQWSRAADLNLARWYTAVVLASADGRVLALGGLVAR